MLKMKLLIHPIQSLFQSFAGNLLRDKKREGEKESNRQPFMFLEQRCIKKLC
jgi:hypothetical protein